MRIKESFSLCVLMTLLLFLLASLTLFAQEEPLGEQASSETGDIVIEGAKATWPAETAMSETLQTATDKVLPRLLIEQAAILWGADLKASQELVSVAGKVTPRLLIEQACVYNRVNSGLAKIFRLA
jgi:precorrin-4 methylase